MTISIEELFYEKIKTTLQKYKMIAPGDRILLAVSGGVDSIVMLDAFFCLKHELGIEILVGHINHGLRGESSEADEQFTAAAAARGSVPCIITRLDTDEITQIHTNNLEATARNLRYLKLVQIAQEQNCQSIATAHTADDQAETILHRLLRSCGISGLAGIHPLRRDFAIPIIRPLLFHNRSEVLQYAQTQSLAFRQDAMNEDRQFTRVQIRKELIPALKKNYNPNLEAALSHLAEIAGEEEEYWQNRLQTLKENTGSATPDQPADRQIFLSLSKAEQRRLLREYCRERGIEIGLPHIENMREILQSDKPQSEIHLPQRFHLVRRYNHFFFGEKSQSLIPKFQYLLQIPGVTIIPELNLEIECRRIPDIPSLPMQEEKCQAWIDAEKIQEPVKVRTRLPGDWIQPLGMTGIKKVKKILQEKKISLEAREKMPLLAVGNEIIWIVGVCVSERIRVEEKTKTIMQFTVSNL